jgi:cell division protease FtsH
MGQGSLRNGFLYIILLAILATFIFSTLRQGRNTVETVPISQIADDVIAGKVKSISEKDGTLQVTYVGAGEDASKAQSRIEVGADLVETLTGLGVTSEQLASVTLIFPPTSRWENWAPILGAFLPILLIGAFFFFILRQAQGAGNQAFSFGKSKARMFTGDKPTVTFEDVAGAHESKEELKEVWSSSRSRRSSRPWAPASPRGCCWSARPALAKL